MTIPLLYLFSFPEGCCEHTPRELHSQSGSSLRSPLTTSVPADNPLPITSASLLLLHGHYNPSVTTSVVPSAVSADPVTSSTKAIKESSKCRICSLCILILLLYLGLQLLHVVILTQRNFIFRYLVAVIVSSAVNLPVPVCVLTT